MQVHEVMTPDVTVVSPYASVCEAAQKMDRLNVGVLPVCDGRRLVGMITDRDIVVRSTAAGESPQDTDVEEVMSDRLCWCYDDDPVEQVEQEMAYMQIRRMPVVDHNKRLVGMVSMGDLLTDRAPQAEDTMRGISSPAEPERDYRDYYGDYYGNEDEGYRSMRFGD
jgi:CBS domain-containing protein